MNTSKLNYKLILSDSDVISCFKINNRLASYLLLLRFTLWALNLLLLVYCYKLDLFFLAFVWFYIAAVVQSFFGYAGIGHEFMHGRVFTNKSINKFFFHLCSCITWNNAGFFANTHSLHHAHTFTDKDHESKSVQSWTKLSIFSYIFIDFSSLRRKVLYSIYNSFGYMNIKGSLKPVATNCKISARLIILFQMLTHMIIYFIYDDLILNVIWLFLPFTGHFISKVLAVSQHGGLQKFADMGPLHNSRTIKLNPFLSFLYASMNYHSEHHLFPTVPHYNLKKLSNILSTSFGIDSKVYLKDFLNRDFRDAIQL